MSNRAILGFSGLKGSGKDTLAGYLVNEHGYHRVAFGDALKEEVAQGFGVTVDFLNQRDTKETPQACLTLARCNNPDFIQALAKAEPTFGEALKEPRLAQAINHQPLSPRQVLQWWGTEFRRAQAPRYWLDRLQDKLDALPGANFVVTDVRFISEAHMLIDQGGRIGRVEREGLSADNAHVSEQEGLSAAFQQLLDPALVVRNIEGKPEALRQHAEHISKFMNQCIDPARRKADLEALWGASPVPGTVLAREGLLFADGSSALRCTNHARAVLWNTPDAQMCGYPALDEGGPATDINEVAQGHDFALVAERFIVDPWVHDVFDEGQAVYDLQAPADAAAIQRLYGSPDRWLRTPREAVLEADRWKRNPVSGEPHPGNLEAQALLRSILAPRRPRPQPDRGR